MKPKLGDYVRIIRGKFWGVEGRLSKFPEDKHTSYFFVHADKIKRKGQVADCRNIGLGLVQNIRLNNLKVVS